MKRTYRLLLPALLATMMILGACSDEYTTTTTISRDCIVSNVTLGTLKRHVAGKTTSGADTTLIVNVTGSLYPMYIDHENCRIFNTDSLPVGTDVEHVVFKTFTTSGPVLLKSLYSKEDSTFVTTDSTDFRSPREFTVYAYDGVGTRTYTMMLGVHQEEADTFIWERMDDKAPVQQTATNRLLTNSDGELLLYTTASNGPTVSLRDASGTWTEHALPSDLNPETAVSDESRATFFACATSGSLYTSADGLTWKASEGTSAPDHLLAVSETTLYGITSNHFCTSADGGKTWTEEACDEEEQVPATSIAAAAFTSSSDDLLEQVVAVGHSTSNEQTVWLTTRDLSGQNTFNWFCLPTITVYDVNCPTISRPSLFRYDDALWLTGQTADGSIAPLYKSADQGRTWTTSEVDMPFATTDSGFALATSGADGFMWIINSADGSLWRGRYNRLGWNEQPTAFERAPRF